MKKTALPLIVLTCVTLMNIGYTTVMTREHHTNETMSEIEASGDKLNANGLEGRAYSSLAQAQQDISLLRSELADIKKLGGRTATWVSETQKVRHEMNAVNNRIEAVEKALESAELTDTSETVYDVSQAYGEDLTPPVYEDPQNDQQSMAVIESVLDEEALDEQWSSELDDSITEMIDQLEISQTQLTRVSCYNNLCRLEIEHADAQSENELALHLSILVSDQLPQANYYQQENDTGGISSTIYLAREGFDFAKAGSIDR
ncbi:MAG: hypothetical protein HRU20_29015 [Pseudomonadales bacterium]|nr:hypothetical protein [Pseudomonadales bacterium]